ncbi:uncharacterized protein LOC110515606 isoform X1 [Oncorhynchus mykiss]|uniref:uncharacterized protein LOC110515606 isoform X1 n=1 Tax=Oncorhynchus mykiss TaxID=8022 RepID=UPI001878948D|nr:uncharacterized protein LOC110515606 isoform X1 [Oncorhynchus mykiss]
MATQDSVEAKTALPVAAKTAFIQLDLSDEKCLSLLPAAVMMPVKQEPGNYLDEVDEDNLKHQDKSEVKPLSPESVLSESGSQFRPGHCDYYLLYDGSISPIPESVTTFEDHTPLSPDSPNTQFRPGHCDYYLLYDVCRSTSPLSVTSDLEYCGLHRLDFPSDSEFTVTDQSSLSEYRPLSPESITSDGDFNLLELLFSESRSSSAQSVASFDEYRLLSPDSPVPHFMPQCCDCYLSFTGSRCSSPESVASNIEFSEFCLEELFAEDRADSPESFISESEFVESVERGLMKLRPLSPESVTSEGDYTSVEFLVDESRPSSPESITSLNEYRSLSPDSPIADFRSHCCDYYLLFTEDRSSSPQSVTSDVEFSGFSLEELIAEDRADSPESIYSDGEFLDQLEAELVQVLHESASPFSDSLPHSIQSETYINKFISPALVQFESEHRERKTDILSTTTMATQDSVEAKTALPVAAKTAFIQLDLSDEKCLSLLPAAVMMPVKQEPGNYLDEVDEDNLKHQDKSEVKPLSPESVLSESGSQFRPGHCDYYLLYDGSISPIPESVTTFEDHTPLSPDSPNTQFRPGHCDYYLLYDVCRSTSPLSVTSDLEYCGLHRLDFPSDSEFTVTDQSSLSEYRPLSPESITSDGDFNLLELLFSESRSSSAQSVASFDEYRLLSPDSPVPHFMPQCCDCYLSFTGSRCSSPESVASNIEFSEFCLEELFAEDRADSPESFISESEFVESVERGLMKLRPLSPESVTSEGDYTSVEFLVDESRPSSPDSITSNDEYRALSPDSPIPQFRPTVIESSVSSFFSRSSSPISVTSDTEGSGFYLEDFVNEERPYSPESFVSESEFVEAAEGGLIKFRPLSPESVTSEDGYTFLELLFAESRPSSPESITSLNEYRSLSPDSPIADFRSHCCDYYLLFTEDRSSSPQSVTSDVEFSGFSLEELIAEDRADSPESIYSDGEFLDQLEAELVQVLHESASPFSDSLPHSIQSETYINKFISPALVQFESEHRERKTDILSTTTMATQDSVEAKTALPVAAKTAFIQLDLSDEKCLSLLPAAVMMPVKQEPGNYLDEVDEDNLKHQDKSEVKPLSPESVLSESGSQFRPGHCDYYLLYDGSISPIPESVTTFEDHTPLSPDSPNTQFRPGHCDYYLLYDVCRSTSPLSVTSDLEYCGLHRLDFPSDSEFTVTDQSSLSEYRPLSPESITSDGDFNFLELLFSEFRSSSAQSVASFDEYRLLSPDSPVPHFMPQCCDCYLSFTGSRCSSPESVASNIEFSEFCLEELFAEDRADSPESFISESEFVESVERGLMKLRPLSPESVTSEGDYTSVQFLVDESRPSSPDSVTSNYEYRALSPDSPIPQFRPTVIESSVSSFFSRSSSPISVTSDTEGSGFYLEEFFNEERTYSPESFVLEGEFLEAAEGDLIKFRPLSPESVTSEDGYTFLELLFTESRPSSPESITSLNEYRSLSPDSPIADFRSHCCDYYLLFTEDRSSSPQSVTSDVEFSGFSLEELIAEDRADSPESIYSEGEFLDQLEAELVQVLHESASPFSDSLPHSIQSETYINKFISPALVQFESEHRERKTDILSTTTMATQDSVEAKTALPVAAKTAFIQLDLSDEKCLSLLPAAVMMPVKQEPGNYLDEVDEDNLKHQDKSEVKPLSPESVLSESGSQFRPGHCDYYLLYDGSISPIPESVTTFEDHTPLSPDSPNTQFRPGHCDYYLLYDVCRSTSPLSVPSYLEYCGLHRLDFPSDSEFTVTDQSSLSEYRPLSPESITSDGDFNFLELLFSEFRSSSAQSVASFDEYRLLSPDSPVPHFMPQCCDCYLSFTGSRCSSPESVASNIEFSEFCLEELFAEDRADSPESFISESEFVESVERGLMKLRPLSPESVTSEGDYTSVEFLVDESRPSSPDSITSNDEYRALSPDSPIPQFRPTVIESSVSSFFSRSSSPISVTSDTEGSGFYLEEFFNEERPYSPESFVLEGEFLEAAEGDLIKFRPLSPESITSGDGYTFLEFLFTESRPSPPESITSSNEYRPLSPDSPIPDFRSHCCDCYLSFTGSRCSSPESVTSDIQFSGLYPKELFTEDRPDSPISICSGGGDDDEDDVSFPKTSQWDDDAGSLEKIPTVHWAFIPQFMVSKAVQTGLSLDSDESSSQPVHGLSKVRPLSPEYRLVYRAVPIKLMSHAYDPANEGETYDSKTGVFEHSGQRYKVIQVLDCQREHCVDFGPVPFHESNLGMPRVFETTAVELTKQDISSLQHSDITDQTVTDTLHKPHLLISQPVETEIITPSPVLAEWEFTQLSSLPEYRPLSPESLGLDMDGIIFYLDHLFTDMRPSSPESVASVNEYRPLSPDSPVPHYGSRIPDVFMTAERRSSLCSVTSAIELFGFCLEESFAEDRADSPESVTSDIEFSVFCLEESFAEDRADSPESVTSDIGFPEFCLDESFAEDRADSPESFISEGDYEHVDETLTKSSPLPPEDEYAHSFVQYWLSELQPSSAEPMTSLDELDAAETSTFTEMKDSESQPVYEFSEGNTLSLEYRLVHKAVPSTLMAHTFDPAYQGETYLNKSGVFEYAKDRQAREIMERLQDKDTVLDRPVTPESITSEEIQSFLNDWSTELRPNSPASVASLDEHRPLSPDSPIPQFIHQCCDNYVELPGDRSSSPQSVMSDVEYCALFLGELIPEHRPDSPDSFLADSEFRESIEQFFRIFRTLTPESVTSEGGYTFLELLFVESRPSSPESVTSVDEYRPLSPDSPVPQFLHQYCDYYGLFPADRSSSPESVTSEIEFSEFCLDESFAEDRADSPESFISEGEYEHVDETLTKSSLLPPEDEYAHSFVQYWLSELQLSSADPMISLDELDAAETSPSTEIEDSESHPIYEFSEGKTSTPEYRLVYKAVPSTLMAHTFDPAYQGDTYLSKTGVFEYAGDRKVRKALDRPHRSGEDLRPVSVEEPASPCQSATPAEEETVQEGSLLTVPHVTDQTVTETLHEPHLPISQPVETEIRTSSPVLAEREFTQSSSLPEYKTLSAESLGSDRDGVLLYLNHFFTDMRPSSPESVVSFDEYRPLSPDSPVPHFMPQCCHCYLAPTGDRSSSPQSETSDIEFSEVCLEELFTEDRADSPESYISEDGMRLVDESDKDMSQDRPMTPDSTSGESLSFVEDWFSELALKPSSPESVSSQEDLSPDSPVLQYGPGLSVVAVSTGEKCWTPESVISDWDEFGLEDLFCATRACSPDSICSNTDTVLTQGDGQRSPPTDQVSTEHEPEMRVERARLKQPPELIDAPFSLVFPVVCQTHRAVEAFFCRASSPDSHRAPVEDVDLDDVETHRPHQASSQSSHVPSDEHNLGSPVAAVRAEEAVHNRPQASRKSIQRKEHSNVPTLKGSEAQTKIDETSKHLKADEKSGRQTSFCAVGFSRILHGESIRTQTRISFGPAIY